ncbi:hypothetical protein ACWCQK_00535 [Streptomyces sp. NPDC002306]
MPAIRVVSASLLGLGALAISASAVVASGGDDDHDATPFGFGLLPHSVAAGGQVTLQIDRDDDDGCEGEATVTSGVFDTVRIASDRASATATIDRDVRAGAAYQVTFTCDGESGTAELTVTEGGPDGATPSPTQVPRAVEAGEGGTLGGFDLKEIGLGTALIAGSIGVAYHLARRRGEEDGA